MTTLPLSIKFHYETNTGQVGVAPMVQILHTPLVLPHSLTVPLSPEMDCERPKHF